MEKLKYKRLEELEMDWNEYNRCRISMALAILGDVRMYKMPNKESKDDFIDAYKKLEKALDKLA